MRGLLIMGGDYDCESDYPPYDILNCSHHHAMKKLYTLQANEYANLK